jgi:hypothetical protein
MKVRVWWASLCVLAAINITAWSLAAASLDPLQSRAQLILSAIYVFGCAFRSVFPVYDIPRRGLVNSWVSSVLLGRTIATLAELAFAAQFAVYLQTSDIDSVRIASLAILPLIVIAEIFSWHAVLTRKNLGHVFENSLWGVCAVLVVTSFVAIALQSPAARSLVFGVWIVGGALFVAYIFIVDVPMYWSRWKEDESLGRKYLSLTQGVVDASRCKHVSFEWEDWRSEVVWMTLYFSVGVWVSISLIYAAVPGGR